MAKHIAQRSIAIAVLLLVVTAVAGAGWFWLDRSLASPLHQARECRVAAQMAQSFIQSVEKRTHAKWRTNTGFNPLLSESMSSEAEQDGLRFVPARLKSYFFNVEPLDCAHEFKRANIPVVIWPRDENAPNESQWRYRSPRITFSRVIFSLDGRYAYTDLDIVNGPLSGGGSETRWLRKDGVWVMDKMTPTWIS